jgi:hypothetical protein
MQSGLLQSVFLNKKVDYIDMEITNINTGICHRRVQTGEPPFFVNWTQDGERMYKFFALRFACEDWKNNLVRKQKEK